MTVTLRDYQERFVSDVFNAWNAGNRNVLGVMPTGCHAPGTMILMFDGSQKPVEQVKVGDLIMGPDSKPRTVLQTIHGVEPMYRVTPTKGEPFIVNENHILSLKRTNEGVGREGVAGKINNISVKEYLDKPKYFKHVRKLWRVGVNFPQQNSHLPVPPYVVGSLLGDGSLYAVPIICSMDPEIHYEVIKFSKSVGITHSHRYTDNSKAWNTVYLREEDGKNYMIHKLKEAGIWGMKCENKTVPQPYLVSSRSNRLEILAGLIDTDGSLTNGGYDFVSKSKNLADDVVFLSRSLGLAAYVKPTVKSSQNGTEGNYWRVSISGDTDEVPVRLARKKAQRRKQIKSPLVTGFTIEPVGEGFFYGFSLSGDHLYLTADFTVHHNSGKTKTAAELIRRNGEPTCLMVHRGELIAQLSEALAEAGITHRIVSSKSTVAMCVSRHVRKFGRSYVHDQSPIGVASVQTLIKRTDKLKQWIASLRLMVIDESHHAVASQYTEILDQLHQDCKLLGVTATPDRCDRKSLAKTQGGVFDVMVEGPTVSWLIEQGYLVNYRYYAPPPSIHMDDEDISPGTGEFKAASVRKKSHESRIVGDIVQTYQRYLIGKQAIVFVVDVETAHEVANAFNEAGIQAAAVSGKTPDAMRIALFDKFSAKSLKVLVNVDLADEGVDVPGLDATIKGRPSMSLGKIRQQQGRALRPNYAPGFDLSTREGRLASIAASDKPFAVLIDHVEAYKLHKFPDSPKAWSLIRADVTRGKKNRDDEIPLRSCTECFQPYEAIYNRCPHCGHKPEPASRSAPEFVDGDIVEFSPELIAKLSGEVSRVDGAPQIPHGSSEIVRRSIERRWRERQDAQQALRHTIAIWAGHGREAGKDDSVLYREFFHRFGLDVLSAQALGATEALTLNDRILQQLTVDSAN